MLKVLKYSLLVILLVFIAPVLVHAALWLSEERPRELARAPTGRAPARCPTRATSRRRASASGGAHRRPEGHRLGPYLAGAEAGRRGRLRALRGGRLGQSGAPQRPARRRALVFQRPGRHLRAEGRGGGTAPAEGGGGDPRLPLVGARHLPHLAGPELQHLRRERARRRAGARRPTMPPTAIGRDFPAGSWLRRAPGGGWSA